MDGVIDWVPLLLLLNPSINVHILKPKGAALPRGAAGQAFASRAVPHLRHRHTGGFIYVYTHMDVHGCTWIHCRQFTPLAQTQDTASKPFSSPHPSFHHTGVRELHRLLRRAALQGALGGGPAPRPRPPLPPHRQPHPTGTTVSARRLCDTTWIYTCTHTYIDS